MANYFNLTIDTSAPSGVTLQINGGSTKTTSKTATLAIGCSDTDKTNYQMKIWGNGLGTTEDTAVWQSYAETKTLTFTPPEGLNPTITFNVKVRDDVWNESATITSNIQYMNSVPTVTIESVSVSKISAIIGKNSTTVSFSADLPFSEYKICSVPNINTSHSGGTVIVSEFGLASPITEKTVTIGKSYNTAGTNESALNDFADGAYIIKVFVKDAESGLWSV